MNDSAKAVVIERCAQGSEEGSIGFDAVVGTLIRAGGESYFADYRNHVITYSLPTGAMHTRQLKVPPAQIPESFDAAALPAAIKGSQRNEVKYPEFKQRSMAPGSIGYIVRIAGCHVTCSGRRGEMHVERFPPAN